MKDHEIKTILGKSNFPKNYFNSYIPDWAWEYGNNLVAIEYENSSRGCVSHVAKYIDVAMTNQDKGYCVCIVRSQHHVRTHKQDFRLALSLAKLARGTIKNLAIFFYECDGTETLLQSVKTKQIDLIKDMVMSDCHATSEQ